MKEWMRPVWDGGEVFRETMAMVEENGICAAPFLYEPEEILRIESYDGTRFMKWEGTVMWRRENWFLQKTAGFRVPAGRTSIMETGRKRKKGRNDSP